MPVRRAPFWPVSSPRRWISSPQIEAMYRMGARTFLEIGPDAKLGALVRAILEGKEHHTLAVDNSRGASGNVADLACTLASLAAHGYAVDLTRWDRRRQAAACAAARADREGLRRQRSAQAAAHASAAKPHANGADIPKSLTTLIAPEKKSMTPPPVQSPQVPQRPQRAATA